MNVEVVSQIIGAAQEVISVARGTRGGVQALERVSKVLSDLVIAQRERDARFVDDFAVALIDGDLVGWITEQGGGQMKPETAKMLETVMLSVVRVMMPKIAAGIRAGSVMCRREKGR